MPAGQYALVQQLRRQFPSMPIVALLVHGGTLSLDPIMKSVDSILDAWYPGMEGGNGIADVLFGLYAASGRAPVTGYRDNSMLPAAGTQDLYPKT